MIRFFTIAVLSLSLFVQWAFGTICLDKSDVFVDLMKSSNFHGLNYERPAKNLHFTTTQDQRVDLRQLRGKLVILTFWTVDSTDWPSEMRSMERLLLKHSSGGLEIIALNLVDPIEKIKAFIKSNPTALSVAFDADKSFSVSRRKFAGDNASYFVTNKNAEAIYEIPQFPTSYLIDQQGMVVGFFSGKTNWNSKHLDRFCSSMLDSNRSRTVGEEAYFQSDARQGIGLAPEAPAVVAGPTKRGPVQAPLGPQAPTPDSLETRENEIQSLPFQPSRELPPPNADGPKKSGQSRNETLKNPPVTGGETISNTSTPKTRLKRKTGSGTDLSKVPQASRNKLPQGSSTTDPSMANRERQAPPVTALSPTSKKDRRISKPENAKINAPLPEARPYYPSQTVTPLQGSSLPIRGLNNTTEKAKTTDRLNSGYYQGGASELPAAQPLPNRNLIGGSILESFGDSQKKTSEIQSTDIREPQNQNQPTTIFQQIGQDVLSLGEGIRGSFSKLFGSR